MYIYVCFLLLNIIFIYLFSSLEVKLLKCKTKNYIEESGFEKEQ